VESPRRRWWRHLRRFLRKRRKRPKARLMMMTRLPLRRQRSSRRRKREKARSRRARTRVPAKKPGELSKEEQKNEAMIEEKVSEGLRR
jgi:hypothetical protein